MARHHPFDLSGYRGLERRQIPAPDRVKPAGHRRQHVMRVLARAAMTGKMFGTGCDACVLQPGNRRGGMPADQLCIRAECARADHWVVSRRVHIDGRRKIDVDSGRGQVAADSVIHPSGQRGIVDRA